MERISVPENPGDYTAYGVMISFWMKKKRELAEKIANKELSDSAASALMTQLKKDLIDEFMDHKSTIESFDTDVKSTYLSPMKT